MGTRLLKADDRSSSRQWSFQFFLNMFVCMTCWYLFSFASWWVVYPIIYYILFTPCRILASIVCSKTFLVDNHTVAFNPLVSSDITMQATCRTGPRRKSRRGSPGKCPQSLWQGRPCLILSIHILQQWSTRWWLTVSFNGWWRHDLSRDVIQVLLDHQGDDACSWD